MKKTVEIKGISTTSTYTDGDCASVVNMRRKNGVLKPVSPRKVVMTLAHQYDELFVHQLPTTGENWIGIRGGIVYFIKTIATTPTEEPLCAVSTAIAVTITQIGNILNILDSDGLKYLIWYDGAYRLIDTNFDGAQTDSVLGPVKVELRVTNEIDIDNKTSLRYYRGNTLYENTGKYDDTIDDKRQEYFGLINKSLSINNQDGYLNGFIFACTAIELYDGSFILHSNPVLLCQSFDSGTRYENIQIRNQSCNYENNKMIFYSGLYKDKTINSNGYFTENRNDFYNLLNGDDYSGGNHEEPVLTNLFQNVLGVNCYRAESDGFTINSDYLYCVTSLNKLQFKIPNIVNEKYKSIIKSVSVFITKESNNQIFNSLDDITCTGSSYFVFNGFKWDKVYNFTTKTLTNKELIKKLESSQQFYKVREIPFDELQTITPNTWIDIDLKGKLGDNLVNQDELPVDNFTHHTLQPQKQMIYNAKLHAMDYKTVLSHGWPLGYFYPNQGAGQFPVYNSTEDGGGWIVAVDIKTETGTSKVVRYQQAAIGTIEMPNGLSAMLSYPDSRAIKMTVTRVYYDSHVSTWKSQVKEFKLTASVSHNYAYYLSLDLKPIVLEYSGNVSAPLTIPAEVQREQIYRNGIKVSGLNNPFYYPSNTTLTVGTGIIRNAGTNAIRMSDGQFGQYQLYVFTSEGIYALETGTTVSYNRISPASLEIPTSDVICATPFGVVFVGQRGLYVINGQEVKMLTERVEQAARNCNITHPSVDFLTFVRTSLKTILYNHAQNELILVGTGTYNYVLNVTEGMIYLSTESVAVDVKNVSPKLLVLDQKTIEVAEQREIIPAWDETITAAWDETISPASDKWEVVSQPVELNTNYLYMEKSVSGQLQARFEYTLNSHVTIKVRVYDADGVSDQDFEITVLADGNEQTFRNYGQITLPNPVDSSAWRVVEFTPEHDGIEVNDHGVPQTGGGYWTGAQQYYLWEDGNFPQNPTTTLTEWVSGQNVHTNAVIVHHDAVIVHHPETTIIHPAHTETVNRVKDYSDKETNYAKVSFITRPMTFGVDEMKKMERAIIRGLIYGLKTGTTPFLELYGSDDGVYFTLLRGFSCGTDKQNLNYKDLDMGIMTRSNYRSYVVKLEAEISEESEISMIDFEVEKNYNSKLR